MALTTVYQYFASNGSLIYVGITDRGVRRAHEHAESKPWWHLATGCTLEHFESRDDALAREKQLIQRFKPPYNYQHNPERNIPVEERAARRLARRKPGAAIIPRGSDLKEKRKAFYSLPKEQRAVAACIICGIRPGNGRPSCLVCIQDEKLANAEAIVTGLDHRLVHRDLGPNEPCPYGSGCLWQKKRDAQKATAS